MNAYYGYNKLRKKNPRQKFILNNIITHEMTANVYININFGFRIDRPILSPEVVVAACAPEVVVAPGAVAEVVGSLQNDMLRMWSVESVHCSFARKQLKHNTMYKRKTIKGERHAGRNGQKQPKIVIFSS